MPQDSTLSPFIIFFDDTAFIVRSKGEFEQLPDSVKIERIRNEFEYHTLRDSGETVIYGPAYQNKETKEVTFSFPFFITVGIIALVMYRLAKFNRRKLEEGEEAVHYQTEMSEAGGPLHYPGNKLNFTDDELNKICSKYNSYYQKLSAENKQKFTDRLKLFIKSKQFYIYAEKGYKEMPVLISAAAVQITFGLEEFLLPYFNNIIIHPDAYLADNPLRILMGNVQGTSITLSWKHFLEDYQNPTDGKNVGLHEMAHALQVQYLFTKRNRTNDFKEDFEHYDRVDDHVLQNHQNKKGLFDAYALKDKNELWATSVELFFERPVDLKLDYPDLYESIKLVLNQDPITMA
jgi:MtfA peptidase